MERVTTDPGELLESCDDETVRSTMAALDAAIVDALPGRSRVLWEGVFWGGSEQRIIGYGDIVQPRPKGKEVEWFLVGLARQKRGYSVYVNAVEDGAYLGQRYADRLGRVKIGAASIGFTRLDALDLGVFGEMLRRADELTPPDPAR